MTDLQKLFTAYRPASDTDREKGAYFEELITNFRSKAPLQLSSWEEVGTSVALNWIIGLQPVLRKDQNKVNDDAAFHQPASCYTTNRGL